MVITHLLSVSLNSLFVSRLQAAFILVGCLGSSSPFFLVRLCLAHSRHFINVCAMNKQMDTLSFINMIGKLSVPFSPKIKNQLSSSLLYLCFI